MAMADLREHQDRTRTSSAASRTAMVSAGGGLAECLCGVAVIGLAIAGLANAYPEFLSGIAQIVFGVGLLCGDAAVVTSFSRLWRGGRTTHIRFAGGLGTEAVGGVAGIVLGILTLLGLVPLVLSAVSVIVFGASVILGGSGRAGLAMRATNRLGWTGEDAELAREAHAAAIGGRALVGLAAAILGIVSVVFAASAPASSLVLALVGLLCLGAGSLLSGAALGGQTFIASNP